MCSGHSFAYQGKANACFEPYGAGEGPRHSRKPTTSMRGRRGFARFSGLASFWRWPRSACERAKSIIPSASAPSPRLGTRRRGCGTPRPAKRLGLAVLALVAKQSGEIVVIFCNDRITESVFVYLNRPPKKLLGFGILALVLKQSAEIVVTGGNVGMIPERSGARGSLVLAIIGKPVGHTQASRPLSPTPKPPLPRLRRRPQRQRSFSN